MDANLKFKTHLLNTFLDLLSRFLRVLLQGFKEVIIWPYKNFYLEKNRERCQKMQTLTLISNPLKKFKKKYISKTSLRNMSKSAYICHVFANNLLMGNFLKTFQWIWNQLEILRFLYPILNFWIKFFLALIRTFCKLVLEFN